MISETSYDNNGDVTNSYNYEYNSDGEMISNTIYDSEGVVLDTNEYTYEYEYDENGNLIKSFMWYKNESILAQEVEYDSAGNIIKSTIYNENGEVIKNDEYIYASADGYESPFHGYENYEELVGETINAIFDLDSEKVLNMFQEDFVYEIGGVTGYSIQSLAEQLSEAYEGMLDTAFGNFSWEEAEISWNITLNSRV